MAQVWLPVASGLPGARHDDPQVAVIRCHCTRHLFLLLSRRHHPCKLPLPAMTFSPGTKKHPVPLPPPPPSSPLLPTQWPWSWKQKGEVWPGWDLPLSPSLPLAQPPGGAILTLPSPCALAKQRGRHSTVHSWSWRWSWQGSSLPAPRLPKRVTQKPWPNSTLTYSDV